ncbi:zinc-binding dehydrogenase [Sphingomonas sp. 35-24ZXX]|uniref:zinc-binding dehydrogenase n=1 Tax=Sphingomonas sp. 35-24ZXX TaxID=1545915 RepID=UPI0006923AF8|nr:zinc-binding dehydrogenase [Sphingomonas sp. 35-24ZXX]
MAMMKAMVIEGADGVSRLVPRDLPIPVCGPSDLLVRVAAAGVNRADLRLSAEHFGGNEHRVAGGEFAGEVVAAGADVTAFAPGDRVMALAPAGYAEYAIVDERLAVRVPDGFDTATAAGLPAWYMTAHNALVTVGALGQGETVLVNGATAGVGIATIQLARLLGASQVIGVARSQPKLVRLAEIGLDTALVSEDALAENVMAATRGRGADLVIDLVGGGALTANLSSAAIGGRMIAVGRLGGSTDVLDINLLAFRRITLRGVTFRSRSLEERSAVARAFAADVLPAFQRGQLEPVIDRFFPLEQAAEAHRHVAANAHFGKTLLAVTP